MASKKTTDPTPSSLVFRNPIPNTADAPQEEIERGEGKWAGGCFFTDAETQQRTWVPDANLIAVRV